MVTKNNDFLKKDELLFLISATFWGRGGGGGGTPYDGLYGEAPQEPFSGFRYIKGREIYHLGL